MSRVAISAFLIAACSGDDGVQRKHPSVPESRLQGAVRTNLDSPDPTAGQRARRQRSLAILEELELPFLESLPVVEDEADVKPRSAEEIVHRCLAVLVSAVKGETNDQALVDELVDDFGIRAHLTRAERRFLADPNPTPQELVDFSWQYEAVHVLLWAVGQQPELMPPNQQVEVPTMIELVRDRDTRRIIASSNPRSVSELLDMADLYYHLHWSAIELRLRGIDNPAVHEGTVRERHRALNWLIRYFDQEWDDVATDT